MFSLHTTVSKHFGGSIQYLETFQHHLPLCCSNAVWVIRGALLFPISPLMTTLSWVLLSHCIECSASAGAIGPTCVGAMALDPIMEEGWAIGSSNTAEKEPLRSNSSVMPIYASPICLRKICIPLVLFYQCICPMPFEML